MRARLSPVRNPAPRHARRQKPAPKITFGIRGKRITISQEPHTPAALMPPAKSKPPAAAGPPPASKSAADPIQRMSVTIPQSLLESLDRMVVDRGFENRSQAVAELIHDGITDYRQDTGNEVMAGSITLFYDQTRNNLLTQLAELQRRHVAEVISSLHVQLERNFMMEVILVQGPAQKLKHITDALVACKGVKAGKLTLTSALLPPLHDKPRRSPKTKPTA